MKLTCQAPNCGRTFESTRSTAKTCSATCRKRLQRKPKGAAQAAPADGGAQVMHLPAAPPPARPVTMPDVYTPTLKVLSEVDRADTPLGQTALVLAYRLTNAHMETGAALAALEKSFRAAYAEAMEGVTKDEDELDGLQFEAFTVITGGRV